MKLKLLCFVITAFSVITYAKNTTTSYVQQEVTNSDFNTFRIDQNASPNEIQRVRLQFSSDDGLIRPLLLGFTPDNAASDGFDYGYDAPNFDQFPNDMFWNINGENYVIQGVGAFDETKQYPLNINITNSGMTKISLVDLENFDATINVFIYDTVLDKFTPINNSNFEINLEHGHYSERFFLTFMEQGTLSVPEAQLNSIIINYLEGSHDIFIKYSNLQDIKKVHLISILGQTVYSWDKKDFIITDIIRIPVKDISEGIYIIKTTTDNSTFEKKIIISN